MKYLIVDDLKMIVDDLIDEVLRIDPEGECMGFTSSVEALRAMEQLPPGACEVAILDINMPELDGLTLAKQLTKRFPRTNIIFVTGYEEYALEAHKLYASSFLTKPVGPRKLREALDHLRYPVVKVAALYQNAAIIGQRIQQYRVQCDLSRHELAEQIGVSVSTIHRWEHGERLPDVITFAHLAQTLQVSMEMLFLP